MRPTRLVQSAQRLLLPTMILVAMGSGVRGQTATGEENPWESTIRRFEAEDQKQFPPKEGVLFVGSSSIVGWDVKKYFPDLPAINRGFGGSQIADSVHFADRIVLPYEPKTIVFYAGDNDIAAGKSPPQVLADYQQFVTRVHERLPQTRIVFVAIKPSLARWKLVDKMRRANALIQAFAEKDRRLRFVDVDGPMIGPDGKPREDLFRPDGLHLNAKGYELWTKLLLPHLKPESATPPADAEAVDQ